MKGLYPQEGDKISTLCCGSALIKQSCSCSSIISDKICASTCIRRRLGRTDMHVPSGKNVSHNKKEIGKAFITAINVILSVSGFQKCCHTKAINHEIDKLA